MDLLSTIAMRCGTDKGPSDHNYTAIYSRLWGEKRFEIKSLLEFGVLRGESLQMWREYFPNADIVGVDVNLAQVSVPLTNVRLVRGSQSDPVLIRQLKEEYLQKFDIIIDDAGHFSCDQVPCLAGCWEMVRPGGYYVIEDLFTSYWDNYSGASYITMMEYLKKVADWTMLRGDEAGRRDRRTRANAFERELESLTFYCGVAVLKKAGEDI